MGVTKKIGAATNSRKNTKKIQKKGGELICKKFGVNGKLQKRSLGTFKTRSLRGWDL